MENGYVSLRQIEKFCKIDIRYMWLLDEMHASMFATIGNLKWNKSYERIRRKGIENVVLEICTYSL